MKRVIALLGGVAFLVGAVAWSATARAAAQLPTATPPCTTLDPMGFVSSIDNPYYPLPVGRTLVYRGVRDGQTQVDRVTVTDKT